MRYLLVFASTILFGSLAFSSAQAGTRVLRDSVGVERANGKTYVLHKVEQGQTLYAVMRRYGVSVKDIKAANEGMADNIQTNQVIRVPYVATKSSKAIAREERKEERKKEEKPAAPAPAAATGMHRVEQGQTLYSIAVKYGVLMADIRKWNGLTSDNVMLGQDLIVSEKVYADKHPTVTPFPTPKVAQKEEKEEPAPAVEKPKKTATEPAPEPEPKPSLGRKMSETGLAEMIETEESSSKYLALHRSAPIGTLVQVTNEFNRAEIWVKVVGRIPDTNINQDIVIKLSSRAFEKLSPNSRRFRAEISYIAAN